MAAADDFDKAALDEFAEIVQEKVETSRRIERVLDDREKPISMHRAMVFGD